MFNLVFSEIAKSVDLLPLQHKAAWRMAISICETEDVQCMIRAFRKTTDKGRAVTFSDRHWKQLRSKGRRKLSLLGAPTAIIDIVSDHLWTICFEISKWITYHFEEMDFDCSLTFCWTPHPSIDYLRTAEMLIRNETLDVIKRFKMACIYCLESEVRYLWEMMSLSERRAFFGRENLNKSDQNTIVLYWAYYIQEVPMDYWGGKTLTPRKLFKYSIEKGYLNATKFFFGKMSTQTRNRLLLHGFYSYLRELFKPEVIAKDHLAIACFILCQLDNSATHFFWYNLVFRYFLEWPWQKHFMTVVNEIRLYGMTDKRTFGQVLEAIFEKDMDGFQDHDYKELLREVWHWSQETSRTYVNGESGIGYLMLMKFVKKHFEFVFEEQSYTLKKKFRAILFQQNASETEAYFEQENVEFFKFLIRERVVTKASVERYSVRFFAFRQSEYHLFFDLPMGELMYLTDALLDASVQP